MDEMKCKKISKVRVRNQISHPGKMAEAKIYVGNKLCGQVPSDFKAKNKPWQEFTCPEPLEGTEVKIEFREDSSTWYLLDMHVYG